MNNPIRHLFAAAALLLTACAAENTEPIQPETLQVDTQAVVLAPGGATTLRVNFEPADAAITAADFALVDATTGKQPANISVRTTTQNTGNSFGMILTDLKVSRKYAESLKVVCAKVPIESPIITVRSKPYMPIVTLTSESPVTSKDLWVKGTIAIDGGNTFEDMAQIVTEVKGRGNTTWGWEKKPYALKLDSKKSVLGMPKHKRWCLIANYMDRTQLRNRVAYYIGQHSNLAWTVRNEYVEFYFNGQYQGLYLLTEQVKEDPNRVNITEMLTSDNSGEAVTGGYLLELDGYFDEDQKFRSASTQLPVNIKYPDPEELTPDQFAYIEQYFNAADAAVASKAGNMFDYFDRASLIDYWIISEVTANHEPLNPKSTYFFKDRGGKLTAGPIWDFDYETLVTHTQNEWMLYDKVSQMMNGRPSWWHIFLQNSEFRAACKKRWQEWKPFLKTVPDFITAEQKAISEALARDNSRWPSINGTGNPNRDESLTSAAATARLKTVYTTRLEWLDTQISKW